MNNVFILVIYLKGEKNKLSNQCILLYSQNKEEKLNVYLRLRKMQYNLTFIYDKNSLQINNRWILYKSYK